MFVASAVIAMIVGCVRSKYVASRDGQGDRMDAALHISGDQWRPIICIGHDSYLEPRRAPLPAALKVTLPTDRNIHRTSRSVRPCLAQPFPIGAVTTMADSKYELTLAEPPPSYESAAQVSPAAAVASSKPLLRLPLPLDVPALNAVRGKRVILASASPRRKRLLAQVSIDRVDGLPGPLALTASVSDRSRKN